jgi:hypothetical protein
MTATEIAVNDLTDQTTLLLDAVNVSKDSIDTLIAAAVAVAENEAIIPLANSVTYLIQTQTLLINILNQ